MVSKRRKCLTCKHQLDEHFDQHCLHYHKDVDRRRRCQEGPDGEIPQKILGKSKVDVVHFATDHAVVFTAKDGKILRYMYKYDECFEFEI